MSFGIQLGLVVKVTDGDFLIGSDWEDGFQFWLISSILQISYVPIELVSFNQVHRAFGTQL